VTDPFARSLARKSERAMQIARLSLDNDDPDSAVNRAYYAMFNMSRAALLQAGLPEGDLPRTHRGIADAFRRHAVLTGKIDAELAGTLSWAESLRLKADYTFTEITASAAADVVKQAEEYVQTVAHVFDLQPLVESTADGPNEMGEERSLDEQQSTADSLEDEAKGVDKMEQTRLRAIDDWLEMRKHQVESGAPTIEAKRSQARENCLKLRQQGKSGRAKRGSDNDRGIDRAQDFGEMDSSNEIDEDDEP